MDTLYFWLKFLHLVAIVAWIGGMFAFMVITARLARTGTPADLAVIGRQSGVYGQIVIPIAMVVTLLAGLGMVFKVGFRLDTLWVAWGWVGIIVSVLLGAFPTRQTGEEMGRLAASAGPDDPRVAELRQRLMLLNVLNLVILLSIVWAMVFKPSL